jgi:hypothetical protein
VSAQDRLFSLVLATPQPDSEAGTDTGRTATGWSRDGWHYEVRGLALVEPALDAGGYDLTLLLSPDNSNRPQARLVQGWRIRSSASANLSNPGPNRATQKLGEAWQSWHRMGRPSPVRYRPVAYPASQPQPVPGYILPRRFYNLVLPFQP